MIEWTRTPLVNGDIRIKKRFAFRPTLCQQNVVVWLDSYYSFQEWYQTYLREYDEGWETLTNLSPSQFLAFQQDITLSLTSPEHNVRRFAEFLVKNKK